MNLNTNTIDISGNLYLQDALTGDLSPLKEVSTKKKGKGRPAKRTTNQHYQVVQALLTMQQKDASNIAELNRAEWPEARQNWFDDIVYGSCNTSVGVNNGKLNVSIRDVKALLRLPEFSSKDVGTSMYTFTTDTRRQRLVAQAARHALDGINHYLHRNPSLLEALENLVMEWKHSGYWWDAGNYDQ